MRPYILDLHSPDPKRVMLPEPEGSPGHRLWSWVNAACGISAKDWVERTQRTALLSGDFLLRDYRAAAGKRGEFIAPLVANRLVVILGHYVSNAMGHVEPAFVWAPNRDWIMIPHPSKKNIFYNNLANRVAAGILLADIISMKNGIGNATGTVTY